VVKFGSGATEVMEVERLLPSQRHFNNGYSEFEHTQPAGLGTRTAMNADEINIQFLFLYLVLNLTRQTNIHLRIYD
jgi:hypothetical protein